MSASEMKRLLRDVGADAELKSRFQNISDIDARIAAAVSAGYAIEKSDLATLRETMSDQDLNSVSGGLHTYDNGWY